MITEALFWGAAATVGYAYAGFPALVLARGALRHRPVGTTDDPSTLSVSVVVAAHDEEASIGDKVRNVLTQDHAGPLECIVVSDGSTDATVAAATAAGEGADRLVVIDGPRTGKATALNSGVARSTGEILVFTDANSRLAPDAVRRLVAPFADPEVGGVAGDQRYEGGDGSSAGERGYWDLDRMLKVAESRAGNVISATGALYAIRRELFEPVVDGVTDDFTISTNVIVQGRRLVFAPDAVAFEPPATQLGDEYRRKVRVMTRGLRAVHLRRELLDPRRTGFYALQLLSHKVLRRLSVVPLLVAFGSALALGRRRPYRPITAAAVVGAAGIGGAAALARTPAGRHRVVSIPAFFAMANTAALHALWNVVTGKRIDRWAPQRRPGDDAS